MLAGNSASSFVDRPEPDHKVVAVVTVTEDRVESGQVTRVAGDDPVAPFEPGPQRDGVERRARPGIDERLRDRRVATARFLLRRGRRRARV